MNDEILIVAESLQALNSRWSPHPGQIPIGKAILNDGFLNVFACCGRNFGKTELAAYLLWRWAWFNPNSECYLFEPEQKQAKEILWASNRIQNFGPRDWIDGEPNNTEMRIRFKNGSFIKIDGSDNYDSYRGVKPKGIIIYDELKDINPKFLDAFEPNRAAYNPPALWIGTPPIVENHFIHYMEEAKSNPSWAYFHAPTRDNPYVSRDWLKDKEEYYKRIGDYETWLREYEAIFVKGGKSHVFPQWLKISLTIDIWPEDVKHWRAFVVFDPASSSTFGVLFILYHPYSRRIKIVDEIYESEPSLMTTKKIWLRAKSKISLIKAVGINDFTYVYDEAASWFRNEMNEIDSSVFLEPTKKAKSDKESGIGLIRDALDQGLVEVSHECTNFKWEMDNYVKDSNGRFIKARDHLIDCFRYFFDASGFALNVMPTPIAVDPDLQKRSYRIEDDYTPDELMGSDFNTFNDLSEID